jgi:hypothetical protein
MRGLDQRRILCPYVAVCTSPTKSVYMTVTSEMVYQQDWKDRAMDAKGATHPLVKASTPRHVLVGFGPSLVKPNPFK